MPAADGAPVLPERVRRFVVDLAAEVLGGLDPAEVSPSLRRVRSFAPVRRARSGAAPIAVGLEQDAVFRQRVAAAWRQLYPELATALDAGENPPAVDPVAAAAGVYLSRPADWQRRLQHWSDVLTASEVSARRAREASESAAELEAARREAEHWRERARAAEEERDRLAEELSGLRRDGRRLRSDADRARAEAREAGRLLEEERERHRAELAERDQRVEHADRRAQEAEDRAAAVRAAAKDGRSAADTRARLLLDTIVEAAAGLRRELALPPAEQMPADVVAAGLGAGAPARPEGPPPRALAEDDPATLDALLRMPKAHLLVDGYNVTKGGYGGLTLAEQRRRLVEGLVVLAARTSAEVTCCFDGADVESRGAQRHRGVRVLFSEPPMSADELIRRLARAEPTGRVVVVVSSDREVADGVRAAGARAVPSAALLRLLGRG